MDLIIGGAWQGKTSFAMDKYGFREDDIFTCTEAFIDFSYPCIRHLEDFVLSCIREKCDPVAFLEENWAHWQETVFLCADLSSGIVPMEAENRLWRNETGRLCQYLSRNAACVSRIFCGLEQKLK